ncbi:hypothetical protein BP5796_03278 [Coleophoma crateriformis]|uniref:Uncharacterized protein n=1 Tax=Coleophoma crateriformis TaxID=565419 RepID=A0A3D8SN25_9HELO|nr:hypothetical protein BP5796_03278 [Coleophoma crateriformis]
MKELPDDDDEDDDEEEEDGLFIPFPGTTKMLRPVPYRGSDPEWQEFVKFSKDPALGKSIREELAQHVRGMAERHPVLRMRCGKGIQLRRYWLDIDYPPVPPPEYERSGIEITDSYIAWRTMPVDSLLVHRIREILWPTAMVKSTWSFTKTLLMEDGKRLLTFFGYQTKTPITIEQMITQQQQQMMQKQLPSKDGPMAEAHSAGDGGRSMGKVPTLNRPNSPGKGTGGLDSSDEGSILDITAPISAHFFRAMMAFKMTLAKTWKPVENWPPRGSILVGGLVELDAPKAWLVFDVRAAWDPQTRQYDPRSMVVSLRRLRPKKQGPMSPMGGI